VRRSGALILLFAVFLVVNLVNAVRKGGDFADYMRAANRFVSGAPLYSGSDVTVGFVGPPVQALLFVPLLPLGQVHELAPRLAWYVVNLVLLAYAVRTWVSALSGQRSVRWIEADGTLTPVARDTLLALLAIAFPLQTQFEHQNLNIVLLALTAYAASAISSGRPSRAGVALGAAAALKAYPLLIVGWLAARQAWRAAGAAILCGIALTLTPAMFRGGSQLSEGISTFLDLSAEGWPARRANQSVLAMWGRYLLAQSGSDDLLVTTAAGGVLLMTVLTLGIVWVPLLLAWTRRRASPADAGELACVAAASTLVSPIAWEHYWVAWFPVFFALRRHVREHQSRAAVAVFWIGAVLITGLSRPTLGGAGARFVRDLSFSTWGVVLTCVVLGILLAFRPQHHRRVSAHTT
jgi:hypothetical protein